MWRKWTRLGNGPRSSWLAHALLAHSNVRQASRPSVRGCRCIEGSCTAARVQQGGCSNSRQVGACSLWPQGPKQSCRGPTWWVSFLSQRRAGRMTWEAKVAAQQSGLRDLPPRMWKGGSSLQPAQAALPCHALALPFRAQRSSRRASAASQQHRQYSPLRHGLATPAQQRAGDTPLPLQPHLPRVGHLQLWKLSPPSPPS